MAESSIFWTTGSTGDGASPYTQAQIFDWLLRTFVNAPATEGILKGYANELAPSGTASPVTIATGAAMVYGIPYENTAPVNVVVPTPVIGTTGHRIVLRASWAAQTVRVVLLSSSDGVAAIPAMTQTPGTTYDLTLATLTITTGGVITLTDTRGYLHPNIKVATQNIDDNAITNAKMADNAVGTAELIADAVDDTKVGNRVPQMYRRQGGDANSWAVYGTTTYTPGMVRMQAGSARITIKAGNTLGQSAVTFPVAFSQVPIVVGGIYLGLGEGEELLELSFEPSATQPLPTLKRLGTTGTITVDVFWLAIGTE